MDEDRSRALARLERIARLLDARFAIPGTQLRIGLDGLLGLLPGLGDALGGLLSLWLVFEARRLGAPPSLLLRMLLNLGLDAALGTVPLAGDLFDVLFKANLRNIALLRRHLEND